MFSQPHTDFLAPARPVPKSGVHSGVGPLHRVPADGAAAPFRSFSQISTSHLGSQQQVPAPSLHAALPRSLSASQCSNSLSQYQHHHQQQQIHHQIQQQQQQRGHKHTTSTATVFASVSGGSTLPQALSRPYSAGGRPTGPCPGHISGSTAAATTAPARPATAPTHAGQKASGHQQQQQQLACRPSFAPLAMRRTLESAGGVGGAGGAAAGGTQHHHTQHSSAGRVGLFSAALTGSSTAPTAAINGPISLSQKNADHDLYFAGGAFSVSQGSAGPPPYNDRLPLAWPGSASANGTAAAGCVPYGRAGDGGARPRSASEPHQRYNACAPYHLLSQCQLDEPIPLLGPGSDGGCGGSNDGLGFGAAGLSQEIQMRKQAAAAAAAAAATAAAQPRATAPEETMAFAPPLPPPGRNHAHAHGLSTAPHDHLNLGQLQQAAGTGHEPHLHLIQDSGSSVAAAGPQPPAAAGADQNHHHLATGTRNSAAAAQQAEEGDGLIPCGTGLGRDRYPDLRPPQQLSPGPAPPPPPPKQPHLGQHRHHQQHQMQQQQLTLQYTQNLSVVTEEVQQPTPDALTQHPPAQQSLAPPESLQRQQCPQKQQHQHQQHQHQQHHAQEEQQQQREPQRCRCLEDHQPYGQQLYDEQQHSCEQQQLVEQQDRKRQMQGREQAWEQERKPRDETCVDDGDQDDGGRVGRCGGVPRDLDRDEASRHDERQHHQEQCQQQPRQNQQQQRLEERSPTQQHNHDTSRQQQQQPLPGPMPAPEPVPTRAAVPAAPALTQADLAGLESRCSELCGTLTQIAGRTLAL